MGRWTTEYYDDVLNSKLKGLVSSAIKRIKLEKAEPTISYKNFVEDLDAGDSFTTTVIDILVKELAERRIRNGSPGDRRLIADRTAKSLRLLATPIRVYNERRSVGRRTVNLTEYLNPPPEEMDMDEDEDEFDSLLNRPGEGVRLNSDLYDAYGPTTWATSATTRRFHANTNAASPPTPTLSEDSPIPPPPPLLSPPVSSRNSVWSLPPAATGSLSRQPSIRRPARSRTVDFNDYTSRHRSITRDLHTEAGGDEPWTRSSQSARRFFPFSQQRRHELHWNEANGESSGAELSDEPLSYIITDPTPSSAAFYTFPTPISSNPSSHDGHTAETSQERVRVTSAPRLRRGGVRPPESLLLRSVSPIPIPITAPQSPIPSAVEAVSGGLDRPELVRSLSDVSGADAEAYPTPSAENENDV
ncbi:hypothetical protein C8J57DRAFT_1390930 [Mycena rebaudengoi]|nr:hypothetical protein C8J57DRAFT_1390930 [Mycena rebaudengoi]